jgi:hypothetical protein
VIITAQRAIKNLGKFAGSHSSIVHGKITMQGVVSVECASEVADETTRKIAGLRRCASVKTKNYGKKLGRLQGAGEIEIQIELIGKVQGAGDSGDAVQGTEALTNPGENGAPLHQTPPAGPGMRFAAGSATGLASAAEI